MSRTVAEKRPREGFQILCLYIISVNILNGEGSQEKMCDNNPLLLLSKIPK